jgi:putative DNA primase/helicase
MNPVPPSLTLHEGRTESEFSRRVHRNYGHHLRYVSAWGKFVVYNGQFWEVDHGHLLDAMIREQARGLFFEIGEAVEDFDSSEFRDATKFGKQMSSASGLRATRALLPSEPGMSVAVDELDQQAFVLNVSNGVVDLRDGKLIPHDSRQLLTRLCPVEFDPKAECPLWRKFISEIFADPELVDHIQKVVGYVLGASVKEQKLFILWGTGANGKSTFVETLLSLMGTYAKSAAPDLLMVKGDAHPTEIADLHGHRLVVCSETEEGRRLAEARVKLLTGGDTLTARRMREDFWTFKPVHKLLLLTNHKPQLHGTDIGIRRRLHLIPFNVTFAPDAQDRNLERKLKAELPGILRWAIEGAIRWYRDGLGEPAAVKDATGTYVADQDIIGQYVTECCIVATWAKVKASSLYANYRDWCEAQGETSVSMKRFGQSVDERGFTKRTSNGVWYDGICIRENE